MGTSQSLSTPKGGDWSSVKRQVTALLGNGPAPGRVSSLIGKTVTAIGGLGGARGGSGGGTGAGGVGGAKAAVGSAVSSVAGFASTLRSEGLASALGRLCLGEIRWHNAIEVVARIAERLSDQAEGLNKDLLEDAFRNAVLDIANLASDNVGYESLEEALQEFLDREGVDGLVGAFLSEYVFDRVWSVIENHAQLKSQSNDCLDVLTSAVHEACRSHVQEELDNARQYTNFERLDWFGRDGYAVGQRIVNDLESRLLALAEDHV